MSCRRIAMWSGPRNISTTMMRSFSQRADTAVIDEPLYAHFLVATETVHPMQEDILSAQSSDWRTVTADLTEATPAPVFFQKHMCHHITDDMGRDWMGALDHFFLIRDPVRMVASYAAKMDNVTPEALGLDRELELFRAVSDVAGRPAPVVDGTDILRAPEAMLRQLCVALELPFDPAMLSWAAGPDAADGVWAPHWYARVQASTGFGGLPGPRPVLSAELQAVADAAMPAYEALREHALVLER